MVEPHEHIYWGQLLKVLWAPDTDDTIGSPGYRSLKCSKQLYSIRPVNYVRFDQKRPQEIP